MTLYMQVTCDNHHCPSLARTVPTDYDLARKGGWVFVSTTNPPEGMESEEAHFCNLACLQGWCCGRNTGE